LKKQILTVWFVLLTIILSGCSGGFSPAPTSTPTTGANPCIVGIWETQDPETFLRASLPVGSFDPDNLKFIKSLGSVAYRFDPQGGLTVEAVQFIGKFDVRAERDLLPLEIRMSGFASSKYEIDGEFVRAPEMLSSDMDYSVVYGQDEMMADVKADAFLPLFVQPHNSARFTCSQQTLSLEFVNFPNIDGPLEFKRLR
jgi:hypothetical protein